MGDPHRRSLKCPQRFTTWKFLAVLFVSVASNAQSLSKSTSTGIPTFTIAPVTTLNVSSSTSTLAKEIVSSIATSATPSPSPTSVASNASSPAGNATNKPGLGPNCAICSFYGDGSLIVQFQPAIQQENGTLTPITSPQQMAESAGPSWLGHQLCCGTDEELFNTKPGQNVTLYTWRGARKFRLKSVGANRQSPFSRIEKRKASSFKKKGVTKVTAPLERRATPKFNVFNATTVPAPICLPLVSINPIANVYHEDLVGVRGANTRWGTGFPVPVGYAISCVNVDSACGVDQTFTQVFSSSLSYSISTSNTSSFTRSLGTTVTTGQESAFASSISDTLEESWSHTSAQEKSTSVADTISQTLTKTSEVSLAKSHTTSDETTTGGSETFESVDTRSSGGSLANSWSQHGSSSTSNTNSNSHTGGTTDDHSDGSTTTDHTNTGTDTQSCHNWSNSGGGTVGVSGLGAIFGIGVSGTYNHEDGHNDCTTTTDTHERGVDTSSTNSHGTSSSDTNGSEDTNTSESGWQSETSQTNNWENTHSDSHGTTSSWSKGHTDSDTTTSTQSDSISDAITNSRTTEQGFSNTESDTVGNSKSKTFGSTNTYSESFTKAQDISNSINTAMAVDQGQVQSIETTTTVSQHFDFTVSVGACRVPVIMTRIKSVSVPWACKDAATNETLVVATDVYPTYEKGLPIVSLALCSSKLVEFQVENDQFNQKNAQSGGDRNRDTLTSGQVLTAGSFLTSPKGSHTLTMDTSGALIFRQYTKVLWTSETDYLAGYSPQARITDQGHLVIEAKGFFNKVRTNDTQYVIMWSTQPMHQQYQVGIYGGTGYNLVVQEETTGLFLNQNGVPDIVLYDSKAVPIWQAMNTQYKNRYGYKHPFDYELPTNVVTKANRQFQNDPHNAIDSAVRLITNTSTLISRDANCAAKIAQNTGIVSPNGRFKLILDGKGNLLVKDGTRTMWSPRTANMWYATPPYSLQLSSVGELFVSDSKGWQTFRTANIFVNSTSGPYTVNMTDAGRLSILDNKKFEVWTAWPLANANTTYFAWIPFPAKWCDSACELCRPGSITQLLSNGRVLNTMIDGELLTSPFSNSSLELSNGTLTFYGLERQKKVFYQSTLADVNNELKLGSYGDLNLVDTNGSMLWSNGIKAENGTYRLFISNSTETSTPEARLTILDANNNTVWDFPSTCVTPSYRHTNGTCLHCADPQSYFDGPAFKCLCNTNYTSIVDYETSQPVCTKCLPPQGLFSGNCERCADKNASIGPNRVCTCNTGYTNQTDVGTKQNVCALPCSYPNALKNGVCASCPSNAHMDETGTCVCNTGFTSQTDVSTKAKACLPPCNFPKAIKNGVCTSCPDTNAHMDETGACPCNDGTISQTDVSTKLKLCAPACGFPRAIKNGVCASCDTTQPQHMNENGDCVCNTGNVWQLETSSNLWKCLPGYHLKSWFGTYIRWNDNNAYVDLNTIPAGADGQWETWRIIYHTSTKVSLQSFRGAYLVPRDSQWVTLSSTLTDDAKWDVEIRNGYWGFKSRGGMWLSARQDLSAMLSPNFQEWEYWTVGTI